jgi:benzoyl-CoA reductase/2-hydroxyglutaryl-CoA dehydratase subunit BcrC/BadD/HgdB
MARYSKPTMIGEELDKIFSKDPLYLLIKNWENIVGKTIKKISLPLKIQNKTLVIGVTNHAWLQEMVLSKNKILENIKKVTRKISDVKILLNIEILKTLKEREENEGKTIKKEEIKLNRQEEILVEIISSKVKDKELRKVIKKLIIKKTSF